MYFRTCPVCLFFFFLRKSNGISTSILSGCPDQNLFHRDRSGFIITDFRIHILNQIPVDLIRNGIFCIQLCDCGKGNIHLLFLRFIQRIVIDFCHFLNLLLFFFFQFHAIILSHQIHGLDLSQLSKHGFFDIIFQRNSVFAHIPDIRSINLLVLVLNIGQVNHDFFFIAGRSLNSEYLIFCKTGSKHDFCIPIDLLTTGKKRGSHHAYQHQTSCSFRPSVLALQGFLLFPFIQFKMIPFILIHLFYVHILQNDRSDQNKPAHHCPL